ncbi:MULTISPECIES: MarR family transcriptional regulator [unclassified Enterococcus]|uniref:MarR family winged helix-turn-helix transcriptional regulator n=1 Tax=unclassified Enterococcus TaxID=2608891 RepID=UPI001551D72D|nr:MULTISPECIES: MarR family transcriptional regulator [unclassified Enterococcus]MBS7576127.1 MarR family transcriptional regulator [Enterococcus sp. MMGLQ5-2]MBS7583360.1 MarR family transcriptional regulator [Enterococcus sp. MMGLQ5-1]NPD11220.1 MarR family transcriptional regulator [Enterococcus sp. MMGLQ5-1]NPD35963.1 MarR family transcriptional regulator [Enterococcus sp. MMGLQ5-2]
MGISNKQYGQILFLLKTLGNQITQNFEKKTGVSLTRYQMLVLLSEGETVLQSSLQQSINIDSAAITRHLKILEQHKFIERKRNPDNNREVLVKITEQGKEMFSTCMPGNKELTIQLYKGIDSEKINILSETLKILYENSKNEMER